MPSYSRHSVKFSCDNLRTAGGMLITVASDDNVFSFEVSPSLIFLWLAVPPHLHFHSPAVVRGQVDGDLTADELKGLLEAAAEVPAAQQQLWFQGRLLQGR